MVQAAKKVEEAKRKIVQVKEPNDLEVDIETNNVLVYQKVEAVENGKQDVNLEVKKGILEVDEKIKVEEERIQPESKKVQEGTKENNEIVVQEHLDLLKIS